ncbi:MAG: transposase [Clostridium sp.]
MNFYKNILDPSLDITCVDITDILKKRQSNINKCPYCNQNNYIKHGHYNNIQRFKCRNINCNKTFSATTKSPWSYSKKNFDLWKAFIKLMFENNTLSHCAKTLNIHISTAFFWRHKILLSLKAYIKPGELKEFIEMSKLKFIENFKGSRTIVKTTKKPIWLVSAVDINNVIISSIVSIGPISLQIIRDSIYKSIPKNAYLHCYYDTHLKALVKVHNKSLKPTQPLNQQLAISFSKLIPKWFYRFKGIATKYLASYLSWYLIAFQKYNNNFIQLITNILQENSFIHSKDIKALRLSCTSTNV